MSLKEKSHLCIIFLQSKFVFRLKKPFNIIRKNITEGRMYLMGGALNL